LTIKAASEEHLIEFETREAAKEALVRARAEIFEQEHVPAVAFE